MTKQIIILNLLTFFLTSCAGGIRFSPEPKLTKKGRKVKIIKGDPPSNRCEELADLSSNDLGVIHAKVKLRNQAGRYNANYLVLDTNNQSNGFVTLTGRAFKCRKR